MSRQAQSDPQSHPSSFLGLFRRSLRTRKSVIVPIIGRTGWVMGIIGIFTSLRSGFARFTIHISGTTSIAGIASTGLNGTLFSSGGNITRVRTVVRNFLEVGVVWWRRGGMAHVSASESCSDPKSHPVWPGIAIEEVLECLPFLVVLDSGSTLGRTLVSIVHCSIFFRTAYDQLSSLSSELVLPVVPLSKSCLLFFRSTISLIPHLQRTSSSAFAVSTSLLARSLMASCSRRIASNFSSASFACAPRAAIWSSLIDSSIVAK